MSVQYTACMLPAQECCTYATLYVCWIRLFALKAGKTNLIWHLINGLLPCFAMWGNLFRRKQNQTQTHTQTQNTDRVPLKCVRTDMYLLSALCVMCLCMCVWVGRCDVCGQRLRSMLIACFTSEILWNYTQDMGKKWGAEERDRGWR